MPIPYPDLSRLDPTVKQPIEDALANFRAVSERAGVSKEDLAKAYGELGMVYHVYEFPEVAVACYRNARSLAPGEFSWSYDLGRVYQDQGDIRRAASFLELAREIHPKDIPVLVNLAETLQADGQFWTQQRHYLQKR